MGRLDNGEDILASGTLEYLENQNPPAWTVDESGAETTLTLKASGGRQPGFRLPWAACNGSTNWQIDINPAVTSDISACSGGGNINIDLSGMAVTRVFADSGGGNLDVILPDDTCDLAVTAKTGGGNVTVNLGGNPAGTTTICAGSGAGNVTVQIPSGTAVLIHATAGLGKVIVDPRFPQVDKNTYKSPDYDIAVNRIEIEARSGAGNVSVITR